MDRQRESDHHTTLAEFVKRIEENMSPGEKQRLAGVEQKRKNYMEAGSTPEEAWAMRDILELTWRLARAERCLELLKEERIRSEREQGESSKE